MRGHARGISFEASRRAGKQMKGLGKEVTDIITRVYILFVEQLETSGMPDTELPVVSCCRGWRFLSDALTPGYRECFCTACILFLVAIFVWGPFMVSQHVCCLCCCGLLPFWSVDQVVALWYKFTHLLLAVCTHHFLVFNILIHLLPLPISFSCCQNDSSVTYVSSQQSRTPLVAQVGST